MKTNPILKLFRWLIMAYRTLFRPTSEVIINGDMELGSPPTNWQSYNSPGTFERSGFRFHSSDYSAHILTEVTGSGFQYGSTWSQRTGILYIQSFWFWIVEGTLTSVWTNGDTTDIDSIEHTITGSWQYWSRNYTEASGGSLANVIFSSTNGGEFYIDDVSVKEG